MNTEPQTTPAGPELRRIMDELAIRDLVAKFSDAANRVDGALFESLWAPDGEWIIGPPINQHFTGRRNMAASVVHMLGLWDFFVQMPTATLVELDGDRAHSRVYVNEVARAKDGTGNYNLSMYADELVRLDGQWLYQKRTYHTIYQDSPIYKGQFLGVPLTS